MKKALIAFFSFALLFVGQQAFASTLWNGAQNDCPSINVANHTTGTGYNSPCWPSSTVSANPGDTVDVRIYYHNSGDLFGNAQTATNTRIVLDAPTGASSSQVFSGQILSDQGATSFGPVIVNMPNAQTLSFVSARWYPNQSQSSAPFINGQNGPEVIGSGLNIGNIAPGWASQGSVVASFVVGMPATTYRICIDRAATNFGMSLPCQYPIVIRTCSDWRASNFGAVLPCTYPANFRNCVITNFNPSSTYITNGQPVTINWNTSNCSSVVVSGPGINSGSQTGSQVLYPTSSGTYTINAYGINNTAPAQSFVINVNSYNNNYPYNINYPYSYPYNNYCTITNFTANGTSTASIQPGTNVTLTWNTNNCGSVSVTGPNNFSNNNPSGSQYIYPQYSGTYTITAYGNANGMQTQQVQVYVNPSNSAPAYASYMNSCAVTTVATNVTHTSAQVNGVLSNSSSGATNTYFEYGTTSDLGERTSSQYIPSGAYFNDTLSGLNNDTIYYYRAVADCGGVLSHGQTEVFATLKSTVAHAPIIEGTTVIGTSSPVKLAITDKYQAIGIGDIVDYTVTYKNISKSTLVHPLIQVVIPKGITLINASAGTYQADSHTQNVALIDIAPGVDGVIYLQGRVDSMPESTAQIVTTAILVYTSHDAQENAMAYVLNTPRGMIVAATSALGASVFFADVFSIGLIGWLLVIIALLLLILALRRYYFHPSHNVVVPISQVPHNLPSQHH